MQVDEAIGEPTEVQALRPDLIRIPMLSPTLLPATRTNSYLVDSGEGWFLIDIGGDSPACVAALDAAIAQYAGGQLAGVVLTHEHPDHHHGFAAFRARYAVPVYAHPSTQERLRERYDVPWRTLDDGATLGSVAFLLTEGHAVGHLAAVGDGYVLCADMLSGLGTIVVAPPDGSMHAYCASLRRLAALGDVPVFPSHGGGAASVRERALAILAHRLAREAKVAAAVEALPRDLLTVTALAYDELPAAYHLLAAHSCLAHLEKLAVEGQVRQIGDLWQRVADEVTGA